MPEKSALFVEMFGNDEVISTSSMRIPLAEKTALPIDDPLFAYLPVGHAADELCRTLERDALMEQICGPREYQLNGDLPIVPQSLTPMAELFQTLLKSAQETKADLKSDSCPCTCSPCQAGNCDRCKSEKKCMNWLPSIAEHDAQLPTSKVQGKSPTGASLREIRNGLTPILDKFRDDVQHLRKNRPLHDDQREALSDLRFFAMDFVHEIVGAK